MSGRNQSPVLLLQSNSQELHMMIMKTDWNHRGKGWEKTGEEKCNVNTFSITLSRSSWSVVLRPWECLFVEVF